MAISKYAVNFPLPVCACGKEAVSNRDTDIVSVVCLEIAQHVGEERYELYFSEVQIGLVGSCVQIGIPNRFYGDWLRTKFGKEVESACRNVLGDEAKIEYRLIEAVPTGGNNSTDKRSPAPSIAPTNEAVADESHVVDAAAEPAKRFQRRKFSSLKTFVPGASNQIAYTSVQSIIQNPGRMSPLFVYGPTGVGKTHLLEGLWNEFRQMADRPRCLYVSAEQFTAAFLENLHGRGMPRFRRRFRDVDLLIIEDVQFFAGKTATISELQYTIEALQREGRQLAFSADRSPARLGKLGPDLVNRFCGGLVLSVDSPDRETRIRILKQGAAMRGLDVPDSVINLVAERLQNDVRKLHGALNRLEVYHQSHGGPVTFDMTLDALSELFRAESRSVNLGDIEKAVCDVFGVEARSLKSTSKARDITQARQLAMWLARQHTRAALSEIGEHFGRRSHSTVISAEKKVNGWRNDGMVLRVTDREYSVDEAIERVQRKLRVG